MIYELASHNLYSFARGPKDTLPDAVFTYALWEFTQRRPEQPSFTFDELAYAPLSPGRAFKLDEPSLAERLDRLEEITDGAWRFSETAGLKQVYLTRPMDGTRTLKILEDYYQHGHDEHAERPDDRR